MQETTTTIHAFSQTLLDALVPVIAAAIVAVLVKLFQRFGIQLEGQQQEKLEHVVKNAIQEVEERASAAMKAGDEVSSRRKLTDVLAKVQEEFPKMAVNEIDSLIHAKLPELGVGASVVPVTTVTTVNTTAGGATTAPARVP